MPFALIIVGLLLIVTGARDTYKQFGTMLVGDFTGEGNFTYWLAAFGALGALGYNDTLRPFARGFMALILISMVIRNGGFFDQFGKALKEGPTAPSEKQGANDNSATGNSLFGSVTGLNPIASANHPCQGCRDGRCRAWTF